MPKKLDREADAAGAEKAKASAAKRYPAKSHPGPKAAVDWRPAYIEALATTGQYARANAAVGLNQTTTWRERKVNPDFAAQCDEALAIAAESLKDEAIRRARDGVRRYKFSPKGEPIFDPETGKQYFELEYSDRLMELLLKARFPEEFREKVALEHSGSVEHKHLTLAEWNERMKLAKA